VDIDYSDRVTLAIETKVVVNFPTARFAVLPISLGLTLNQLSATVSPNSPPFSSVDSPRHQTIDSTTSPFFSHWYMDD
jgi:hypothetical protein